uniref:Uncharacterized protein n=1 Tax=Trichobilharzia regenti TaxID=157069 RepID=A0AA85JJ66_TRIRE|nr:unnamed protein product [Trichobilharzia regenti]
MVRHIPYLFVYENISTSHATAKHVNCFNFILFEPSSLFQRWIYRDLKVKIISYKLSPTNNKTINSHLK